MPNPSTTKFDARLQEIPHYQSFPAMTPYVGGDYESEKHVKMLLIGESFYFPDESTIHKDAEQWYRESQGSLNGDEVQYFDCRGLLECPWQAAGHKMYREINHCLDTLGLDFEERAISNVAYMNAFMRPAEEPGESFKHYCTHKDRERSVEVTDAVIKALQPDLVIYVSKYAWDCVGWQVSERNPSVSFEFTSHPAGQFYWNRKGYEHGRPKFIKILEEQFMRPTSVL